MGFILQVSSVIPKEKPGNHEEVATFDDLSPQLDHIKNLHSCFFIVFTMIWI